MRGMTQARIPFAEAFDHLVYVRVFEGCNLHCEHCFIPSNPKRMTHEDVARVAEHVRSFAPAGARILVQWHGGEPTMFGASWLELAMDALEAAGPEFVWSHGIQTNLMTYDHAWGDLYRRRFAGNVGVSWDPQIRLLRRGDRDSNAGYETRFRANLAALIADGMTPYLVVTGTKILFETFANPIDFFEYLESMGVRRGHIERITRTGYARSNWDRVGLSNKEWSRGMSRYMRAYVRWHAAREGGRDLQLSPFDGLRESGRGLVRGAPRASGCLSGSCDTTFHTVDASGYKRGCTALTSETDNKRADKDAALSIPDFEEARKERQVYHCFSCEFRQICSSGCLALDIDDGSGECSGGSELLATAKALALAEREEAR